MVKESIQLLNKSGTWYCDGLLVNVKILDIRNVYGRIDYLVTPVMGKGEKWISADRIKIH